MNLKVNIHDSKVVARLDRNTLDGPLHLRLLTENSEGNPKGDVDIVIFKADIELFLTSMEEAITKFRNESHPDDLA